MPTSLAAREVLVVGLAARIERVFPELSVLIAERPGLAWKAAKTL